MSNSEQFQLLDLPLEIRLRIYTSYFASNPIWISKIQKRESANWETVKHISCRLYARSYNLLVTCKQVLEEAKPLMFSESVFNFALDVKYRSKIAPKDIPETILAPVRSIVCHRDRVNDWLETKKNLQITTLPGQPPVKSFDSVALVDDSLFLYSLTQNQLWGYAEILTDEAISAYLHGYSTVSNFKSGQLGRLSSLRAAIASLHQAKVNTIIIQNTKAKLKDRDVVLRSVQSHADPSLTTIRVTVRGVARFWEDRAKTIILNVLKLNERTTAFVFLTKDEQRKAALNSQDYYASFNNAKSLANRLNAEFHRLGRPVFASIDHGEVILGGRIVPRHMVWRLMRDLDKIEPESWFDKKYEPLLMRPREWMESKNYHQQGMPFIMKPPTSALHQLNLGFGSTVERNDNGSV